MNLNSLRVKLLLFNILLLGTALSPFIGKGGMNNLLIAGMVFSVILTGGQFRKINKNDWAIYLLPITMLITGILHINSFRVSSYLYGLLFILFFITNLNLIRKSDITINQFQTFIKFLIYSFFIVLLLQQVMYVLGIENFINKIFAIGFKFNALATEPSHAAIVIIFLFYTYIKIKEKLLKRRYALYDLKQEKLLWFIFFYQMITFGSSYGILLMLLFILTFLNKPKYAIGIIALCVILIQIALENNFIPAIRIISVIKAYNFSNLDFSKLVKADHSASIRIIPMLYFFYTPDFWSIWGKGMDFSANFFPTIIPGVEEGTMGGGLMPSFVIDNGLINTILLVIIILKNGIQKNLSFGIVALLFTLLNTSFNSQLFWFVITLLTLSKYLAGKD